MRDDDKEPPFIELHESEWHRTGKHEPILGPNGKHFLIYFVAALISAAIVHHLVALIR